MAFDFYSEEDIKRRLQTDNPWWKDGRVLPFYSRFRGRPYLRLFLPLVVQKEPLRALVLMGPRRVGKTVLIHHTIQYLLDRNQDPAGILYASVDTPILTRLPLEKLLFLAADVTGKSLKEEMYVFFDEIQYLKDWELHLKSLVDTYKNIKFVVSGSAAAALRLKSIESGAGRFTDFVLPPLTFYEYLELTDTIQRDGSDTENNGLFSVGRGEKQNIEYTTTRYENDLNKNIHYNIGKYSSHSGESKTINRNKETMDIKLLNRLFAEYVNYGGYPELLNNETIKSNMDRHIKHDIIEKVLLKDLPGLYGIPNIQELNALFTYLAYNSGKETSLEALSKGSGVSKNTLRRYLEYLEAAFLIRVFKRVDYNSKLFKRDNFFKIYLVNSSMRSALFEPLDPENGEFGHMVETALFTQWLHTDDKNMYYARWRDGEVDLVFLDGQLKPIDALEIKWSDRAADRSESLTGVLEYCKHNKLTQVTVTTREVFKTILRDGIQIQFVPASLYALMVGASNIMGKLMERSIGSLREPS